jgi:prepilin-type N-terminal cleavage/methylation domain-containing protein
MNPRRPHPHSKTARRGYTAVEVLMAMTVMAIGAASVISMQKASMQGNLDARKTDVANSIARLWIERIQRDAMMWTTPGPTNPTAVPPGNIANGKVLNAAAGSAGNWILPNQYLTPTTNYPALSPGFDILGRDLVNADLSSALYCVNVKLTWLTTNQLARVDVRVLWPRRISNAPPAGGFCDTTTAAVVAPNPLTYHSVYLTTAVRGNPQ